MSNYSVASSADYADALLSARRAKNVLIGLILVILLFQLSLFFAARYKIHIDGTASWIDPAKFMVGLTDFLGVVLPIVLAVVLLLMVLVMIVGRVLGVSHLVSAFIACVVLATLLFPWQAFLMNQTFNSTEFKWPGVLYNWSELLLRVREQPEGAKLRILFWARFVGWPVAALAILAKIYFRSASGLRWAIPRRGPATHAVEDQPTPPPGIVQ